MIRAKSVLVVEDEAIMALDLQQWIAGCGYEVIGIADSCIEALRMARARKPDIVFMDYGLKGNLDGATAARELSKQSTRIVFVTAHLDRVVRDARDIAARYLAKPISRNDITQALIDIETGSGTERTLEP